MNIAQFLQNNEQCNMQKTVKITLQTVQAKRFSKIRIVEEKKKYHEELHA